MITYKSVISNCHYFFFLKFSSSNAFSKRPAPVKENSKTHNITAARIRSDIAETEGVLGST